MKNIIMLIFISVVTVTAQNAIRFGGGLNMSSSSDEEETGLKLSPRFGFNVGGAFEIGVAENFAIVPGISVETRGENAEISAFGQSVDGKLQYTYLQVPVLGQLAIDAQKVKINLFGGPELGYGLSRKLEIDGTEVPESALAKFEKLDFGVTVGAGLDIPVGGVSLVISPSYFLGFMSTLKDDASTNEDEAKDNKNRNIKINVSIKKSL